MRFFPYITVGKILKELKSEGISLGRVTFYRLEKKYNFPSGKSEGSWRIYTSKEVNHIKSLIKKNYRIETVKNNYSITFEFDFFIKLHELKSKGIVTEKEFELIKKKKLSELSLI